MKVAHGAGKTRRRATREVLLFLTPAVLLRGFKGWSFLRSHPGTAHVERIALRLPS